MKICGTTSLGRNPIFQVLFFVLVSFAEFAILELFFDIAFVNYEPVIILKNVLIISALNLFLTGIFHHMKPALMISILFFMIVGIANYFVIAFRGYGIVFMDLYAVKTAATLAGSYDYSVNLPFVAAVLADVALFSVCILLPERRHSYRNAKFTLISLLGMSVSALFFFWIDSDIVFFRDVSGLTWDHNIGMKEYGYVLYFSSNAGKATVSEPIGYSVEKVDEILSRYEAETEGRSSQQNPNLIMIMNESFSDLNVLGRVDTNQEVMPFYKSLSENVIKGYAESSVYGGYTANSEFEFLTGCTKAFLPGNPYLQYIDNYIPTLIDNLKVQQGYQTAVAIHPYYPSGYNRNRVYPLLGFDEFLSLEDFRQTRLVRDYVGDWEDYEKIEELYENKKEGTSLCIFNVTMQNHNPYDDSTYQFENPVKITNFNPTLSTNQYLSLMKMSDEALENLVNYFKKEEEPTVILLFGDHQPHLSDSFYEKVVGKPPKFFSQEEVMKKHLVPFMIWANYDIEEQTIDRTSINYLSSILLQAAGLKMSDYNRYLLDLSQKLPSISASGYYDEQGVLHEYSEEDDEYQELLKEYEMVQYHYLFGGKERLEEHFSVD